MLHVVRLMRNKMVWLIQKFYWYRYSNTYSSCVFYFFYCLLQCISAGWKIIFIFVLAVTVLYMHIFLVTTSGPYSHSFFLLLFAVECIAFLAVKITSSVTRRVCFASWHGRGGAEDRGEVRFAEVDVESFGVSKALKSIGLCVYAYNNNFWCIKYCLCNCNCNCNFYFYSTIKMIEWFCVVLACVCVAWVSRLRARCECLNNNSVVLVLRMISY